MKPFSLVGRYHKAGRKSVSHSTAHWLVHKVYGMYMYTWDLPVLPVGKASTGYITYVYMQAFYGMEWHM